MKSFLRERFDYNFALLILQILVFIGFSFYVASNIRLGISPDEVHHFEVSVAYSETLGIPDNSPETHQFGDITRGAFMYYWINGRILNLNFLEVDELVLLRSVNIVFSVLTLFFTFLLSKEVIKKRYFQIIPTILLANTLMFAFLSGMVNYDNLVNLFAVLSVLMFVKFLKNYRNVRYLFFWLIFASLGALTKFTILPLFLIQFLIIISEVVRKKVRLDWEKKSLFLFLLAILTFVPIVVLYGGNYLKYGRITPSCDQVMTVEQCMNSANFSRDYGAGRDLDFTTVEGLKGIIKTEISVLEYFPQWIFITARSVYGILGHINMFFPSYFYSIPVLCGLIFSVLFIRKWKKEEELDMKLIIVMIFYILVLSIFVNYKIFLNRGIHLALQGRYVFPIIPIYYVLLVKYYSLISNKYLRYGLLFLVIVSIMYLGIPMFLQKVPPDWFFKT